MRHGPALSFTEGSGSNAQSTSARAGGGGESASRNLRGGLTASLADAFLPQTLLVKSKLAALLHTGVMPQQSRSPPCLLRSQVHPAKVGIRETTMACSRLF